MYAIHNMVFHTNDAFFMVIIGVWLKSQIAPLLVSRHLLDLRNPLRITCKCPYALNI